MGARAFGNDRLRRRPQGAPGPSEYRVPPMRSSVSWPTSRATSLATRRPYSSRCSPAIPRWSAARRDRAGFPSCTASRRCTRSPSRCCGNGRPEAATELRVSSATNADIEEMADLWDKVAPDSPVRDGLRRGGAAPMDRGRAGTLHRRLSPRARSARTIDRVRWHVGSARPQDAQRAAVLAGVVRSPSRRGRPRALRRCDAASAHRPASALRERGASLCARRSARMQCAHW